MDEKPKSIWKKSWKGPCAILVWLLTVLIAAFFVALAIAAIMFVSTPTSLFASPVESGDFVRWTLKVTTVFVAAVAVTFIFYHAVRWLFCWRNFKRFLFGFACFATLIALFYAEEDWRGKHDWEKFKREWETKGEHFDFASVIPAPVPDDQNFALTPIVASSYAAWLDKNGNRIQPYDTNVVNRLQMETGDDDYNNWPTNGGNWQLGKMADLNEWQNYYRTLAMKTNLFPVVPQPQTPAQDVLIALSKYDSAIEELREASQLPYSRFPLNYESQPPAAILLPHLAALKRCSLVLRLRAIAELQNSESQKALDDVKLSLRLIDSIRTEPFLISHLVRIAILQITLQPVYEGLAEHKWSDAQLADLDSELAKLDFLTDYESAIRGERALEIANIEFLRHPPRNPEFHRPRLYFLVPFFLRMQELSDMSDEGSGNSQTDFQMLALGFGPSGWLVQNELRIAQFDTKWYLPIVDEKTQTISPDKARAPDSALDQEIRHRTPENLLERLFVPSFGSAAKRFAYAQSSTDLARVAIALERYRLAHGEFPESLDVLAPQFLEKIPHDVIGGPPSSDSGAASRPLHYRRTSDGQFILYSVGWNETDDGGVVEPRVVGVSDRVERKPIWDYSQGDWVWRYPQK